MSSSEKNEWPQQLFFDEYVRNIEHKITESHSFVSNRILKSWWRLQPKDEKVFVEMFDFISCGSTEGIDEARSCEFHTCYAMCYFLNQVR